MTDIPTIDWRPAGIWRTTDFVQTDNPAIEERFETLDSDDDDTFTRNVADHVRDNFTYPLSFLTKNPAPDMQMVHGSRLQGSYYFRKCIPYSWLFPTEVEKSTKEGICVDTTNLAMSYLRRKKLKAWAVLGIVKQTSNDELIGYHAWCEIQYLGQTYVLETTVHDTGKNNLIPMDVIYNKKMPIYYVPTARYNEKTYKEKSGSAVQFVKFMGTNGKDDPKKWKRLEKKKQYAIWANFDGVEVD